MERFKIKDNYHISIDRVIKKQNLLPLGNVSDFIDLSHHTVVIPCLTAQKEEVLLRILIASDKKKDYCFNKEFFLYKFFKKSKMDFNNLPQLITGDIDVKFKWAIRKYYVGEETGNFWSFKDEFLTQTNLELLVKDILKLQEYTKDIKDGLKKVNKVEFLPKRKASWFLKNWKHDLDYNPDFIYDNFIKIYFLPAEIKKVDLVINKDKRLLNKYSNFFSHGDLMPQNILIDKHKKTFFIDWEESHLNNPLFDASYIYVNSWNNKNWRNKFLKKFIKFHPESSKSELYTLANLNNLLISIRMAEYAYLNLIHKNPFIKKVLKNHIQTIKDILVKYKI